MENTTTHNRFLGWLGLGLMLYSTGLTAVEPSSKLTFYAHLPQSSSCTSGKLKQKGSLNILNFNPSDDIKHHLQSAGIHFTLGLGTLGLMAWQKALAPKTVKAGLGFSFAMANISLCFQSLARAWNVRSLRDNKETTKAALNRYELNIKEKIGDLLSKKSFTIWGWNATTPVVNSIMSQNIQEPEQKRLANFSASPLSPLNTSSYITQIQALGKNPMLIEAQKSKVAKFLKNTGVSSIPCSYTMQNNIFCYNNWHSWSDRSSGNANSKDYLDCIELLRTLETVLQITPDTIYDNIKSLNNAISCLHAISINLPFNRVQETPNFRHRNSEYFRTLFGSIVKKINQSISYCVNSINNNDATLHTLIQEVNNAIIYTGMAENMFYGANRFGYCEVLDISPDDEQARKAEENSTPLYKEALRVFLLSADWKIYLQYGHQNFCKSISSLLGHEVQYPYGAQYANTTMHRNWSCYYATGTELPADATPDLLYHVLGVARTATTPQIKHAYKKKALLLHPDKFPSTTTPVNDLKEITERFTALQEAYEILTDSTKRLDYDQNLSTLKDNGLMPHWKQLAAMNAANNQS